MGLAYGEQVVVWGIRQIVGRQGLNPDLPAEFKAAFGQDSDAGLQIFFSFFRLLGQAARKSYAIAPPSTLRLTQDEQHILTLLSAAQWAAASGHHDLLEAHLLWLATCNHRAAFARVTLAFAALLAEHGYSIAKLPVRRPIAPVMPLHQVDAMEIAPPNALNAAKPDPLRRIGRTLPAT